VNFNLSLTSEGNNRCFIDEEAPNPVCKPKIDINCKKKSDWLIGMLIQEHAALGEIRLCSFVVKHLVLFRRQCSL